MRAEIGPEADAVDFDKDEGGQGEDGAGYERFADAGSGAGDVLLEYPALSPRIRNKAMAMTAAGMVAAMVWPAFMPR